MAREEEREPNGGPDCEQAESGVHADSAQGTSFPEVKRMRQDTSMTDSIDSAGYRANVGIILVRPNALVDAPPAANGADEEAGSGFGDLFLGGRPGGGGWQFPQGGVYRGEGAEQAMYRELAEEIGLGEEDVELLGSTRQWLRYRLPKQYQRRRSVPLCIGQKQRWFLLRLKATEDKLRFDATQKPEFDRWRWVPYWTPVREVIYFKRQVYARALHELAPLIFPDGLPPYPDWWQQHMNSRHRPRRRNSVATSRRRR